MSTPTAVRLWLGLALVAVLVEQATIQYTTGTAGPHLFWGGLSLLLLYLVLRGRHVARLAFLALAVVGLVAYVWRVPGEASALVLTLAYAVQAATMLVPAVRGWTRADKERRAAGDEPA